ncbi:hypothetical protein LguiA_034808 [Lonicera macranthoides]
MLQDEYYVNISMFIKKDILHHLNRRRKIERSDARALNDLLALSFADLFGVSRFIVESDCSNIGPLAPLGSIPKSTLNPSLDYPSRSPFNTAHKIFIDRACINSLIRFDGSSLGRMDFRKGTHIFCRIKKMSGISLLARATPEGSLLRPPPKLHKKGPKPIPGNSEAS